MSIIQNHFSRQLTYKHLSNKKFIPFYLYSLFRFSVLQMGSIAEIIAEMSIALMKVGLRNWDHQVSVVGLGEESSSDEYAREVGFEPDDDDDDDGYDYEPAA